jgi:hypothetical protein
MAFMALQAAYHVTYNRTVPFPYTQSNSREASSQLFCRDASPYSYLH